MPMLRSLCSAARTRCSALMALSLLAGCSSTPVAPRRPVWTLDSRASHQRGARAAPPPCAWPMCVGPGRMDGNAIYYRLAYAQSQRT
ncbi:hypothetical protein ACU4HD_47370 [Cupriavidus basilensis]